MKARRAVWTSLALAACACGGSMPNARGAGDTSSAALCPAVSPLIDLRDALGTPASFGASSELFYLVDVDQELGYLDVARARLGALHSRESSKLDAELQTLSGALTARRDRLASAVDVLAKTQADAEAALDAAATCRGIDQRETKPAGQKARDRVLASRACESATRLWASVRDVDLSSDVSTASKAAHIKELSLDKERGLVRDRLARALKAHAAALRRLHGIADPSPEDPATRPFATLRDDVAKSIEGVTRVCYEDVQGSDRIVAGHADPRRVTVTVRPVWSGALAPLPHPIEFGSGFVVRWREPDGKIAARIVTNNHVMDEALEADIVPGDPNTLAGVHAKPGETPKAHATLLYASPDEDIAILAVDPKFLGSFSDGLPFRLAPVREEEQVVAAGFPGVGASPSFQVSRGSVSNAHFGAEGPADDAADAYVQHTAAIDPGNSGGPLLDDSGRLIGMNTMKIVGRENVGVAIPTWRIQAELLRSEEAPAFDEKQAEASCNAVLAALASPRPVAAAMSRFSLALYEQSQATEGTVDAAAYRDAVQGEPQNPVDIARREAYASLRARVERERGVAPFQVCSDVRSDGKDAYRASFHTRSVEHSIHFRVEQGALRVTAID